MAKIVPFRAFRPPASLVSRVAAPPYDVVTTQEARRLAAGNPDSFLHISRPEIDLPEGIDEHADAVYARAVENLRMTQTALGTCAYASAELLYGKPHWASDQ